MIDLTETEIREALRVKEGTPLYDFIQELIERANNKDDNIIGNTGYEGSGKSTLARFFGANYSDSTYTFRDNIFFADVTKDDILRRFRTYKRKSVMDFDEAVNVAYNQTWYEEMQKVLVNEATMIRERRHLIIMNMPNLFMFSPYFRQHRIFWHVDIIEKGYAVVYKRQHESHSKDPFKIKEIQKIKKWWYEEYGKPVSLKDKLAMIRNFPSFHTHFSFPKLPNRIERHYEMLREEAKKKYRQKVEDSKDMNNKYYTGLTRSAYFMNKYLGLSQREIGNLTDYTSGRISEFTLDVNEENIKGFDFKKAVEKIRKKIDINSKENEKSDDST